MISRIKIVFLVSYYKFLVEKPLAELNANDIYNTFLLSKKVYTNSQSYWSSKFPNIEID